MLIIYRSGMHENRICGAMIAVCPFYPFRVYCDADQLFLKRKIKEYDVCLLQKGEKVYAGIRTKNAYAGFKRRVYGSFSQENDVC